MTASVRKDDLSFPSAETRNCCTTTEPTVDHVPTAFPQTHTEPASRELIGIMHAVPLIATTRRMIGVVTGVGTQTALYCGSASPFFLFSLGNICDTQVYVFSLHLPARVRIPAKALLSGETER